MKKLLVILLTLFSLQSFAQDTTYVKVRGIPGAYNFSKNAGGDSLIFYVAGVRHALSVGSTVDLSNYYNKGQIDDSLATKLNASYKQSITAIKPLHWNVITPDSATIGLYVDTTSSLSDGSDTTVPSTKAVRNYIDANTGAVNNVDSLGGQPASTYSQVTDTLNQKRLPYWKKWVLFGDSFSASSNHYSARVDTLLNMTGTVTNAVSGAMISGQSAKIDSIISANPTYFKSFDIASLLIGVNDWAGATYPLGLVTDSAGQNTYAGYLKHIIEAILTSNPLIELYIMTPTEANSVSVPFHGINSHGWSLANLANLDALICAYYGVQCIDLHNLANFNLQTIPVFTDDGLHPNYYGSIVLANIIAGAFTNHNNKGDLSSVNFKNGFYGVNTFSPVATLDVAGSSVNSSLALNHYKSIASFFQGSVTGTMKIMFPKGWSDNVMTIVINGYDFSAAANWQVIISGKNLASGSWSSYKARIVGSAPFSLVRLSYDSVSSKNVILLGDTSTSWTYPSCEVSDLILNQGILSGWGNGWAISVIPVETNIATSKTVTPTLASYTTTDGRTLFGTTKNDGKGKVQVNGRITYSVDPVIIPASDTLVVPPTKWVISQLALKNSGIGNTNYIPYWNGAYSLTPSTFSISGDNLYGNGTNAGFQVASGAVWSNVAFRATGVATGMYWDDTYTSIRWLINGANGLKLFSNKTLQYYSHPSVSASPYVIPDITQVDSAVKYRPYIAKSVSYTATLTDRTIEITATGQTITLPTSVGIAGKEYIIKLTASGSATVATTSSQTIDGSTTYSLSAQYKYVTVQSNGTNWIIIGNN